MSFNAESHRARRAALNQRLPAGLVILPTAPLRTRSNDTEFPFRFDSDFFYLTGFQEPQAVLVQVLGAEPRSILFCQPKDELKEIWDGFLYGPAAAREAFGFDEAYPIAELDTKLVELMSNQPRLYYPVGADLAWDKRVHHLIERVRARAKLGVTAPAEYVDIRAPLSEMRLIKDASEIAVMREAGRISSGAHIRAMQTARAGQFEYEVEAELLYHFYKHGSRYPAYGSIVASGANATCLHYQENNRRMAQSDLLLIDAGCELGGYASDITRTFPIGGKFSGPQKAIYELVLAGMQAAFEQVRPGVSRIAYHDAAVKTITQGLVDLDILKGNVDGLIEREAHKQFFMHGTGHWIGLDVHDAGEYMLEGRWRALEPGMALTVEPGLYFRPLLADSPAHYVQVPEHFMHIGVRIEDDLVVTADGHENLTALTPKTVADVEATMAG